MVVSYDIGLFRVYGFSKKSKTFLSLLLIGIFSGTFGISLVIALPAMIISLSILFPGLYYSITRRLIKISNNGLVRLLSVFPNIEFNGEWYLSLEPPALSLSSISDIGSYLRNSVFEISVIHLIFMIFGIRFGYAFQGGDPNPSAPFFGLTFGTLGFAIFALPFLLSFYFTLIWIIRDSGLKLYRLTSTNDLKNREFEEIFNLENSFKSLFGLFIGIPSLFWIFDYIQNNPSLPTPVDTVWLNVILFVISLYGLTIGVSIVFLILLVNRPKYEELVNQTRLWIRDSTRTIESMVSGSVPAQPPIRGTGKNERPVQELEEAPAKPLKPFPKEPAKPLKPTSATIKKSKYCIFCGQKMDRDMKFCISCGRKM